MHTGRFARAVAFTLASLLATLPALAADATPSTDEKAATVASNSGTSVLSGKVKLADGHAAGGLTMTLAPLESRSGVVTAVVGADGTYKIEGLLHGLYDVSFSKDGQAWVGNRVLLVSPKKKQKANFQLGPFLPGDKTAGLEVGSPAPGTKIASTGVARLEERTGPSGLAWFRTGKGVAVLIGGSALIVGAIIALGKNSSVSNSTP